MVELSEWIAITIALAALLFSICYLIYFKVTKKLFPETAKFCDEIKSGKSGTVYKFEGTGIIKMIELETDEKCIITVTADGIIHTLLTLGHAPKPSTINLNDYKFAIREQLNEKFFNNFTIHVQNQGSHVLNIDGKINFEIKKGLKESIKAIFSEIN